MSPSAVFRKVFLASVMVLCLAGPSAASILLDRVVAVVDREIITWSELYMAMSFDYQDRLRNMAPEEKKAFLEKAADGFLDRLIDRKLQLAAARKNGVSATEEEVRAAIDDIRKSYGFSMEEFRAALKREGFRYEDYTRRIAEQITIQKYVRFEIYSKTVVSDREVEEYYEKHRDEFPLRMLFRFSEIRIKAPPGDTEEARGLVRRISEMAAQGIDFKEIMERIGPDDRVTFLPDTGYIAADELRSDFVEALRGLKAGDVTAPIESADGIHVLKVIKMQSPVSVEVIKDNIRELLANKVSEERYRKWVRSLRRRAMIEIKL